MDDKALYDKLSSIDLGSKDDNYFRSMGVGFDRGRQDAIDYLGKAREKYDPLTIANKTRQYNIQANQPAIQQLQKTSTDLDTRYKDLLSSIKGGQKVAEDAQILATNNELGRRGISADSGVAQQQTASALRPIASDYASLTANTGMSQQKELSDLALQIANLQSGNPMESLNFASGIADREEQKQQFEKTLAQRIAEANRPQQQQQDRYTTLGEGQTLYDLLNGGAVYTAPKSYAPKSGISDSGW